MKKEIERYSGKWVSEHGQVLTIRYIPYLRLMVASYKPVKGRRRVMLFCSYREKLLYIGLSFLHWLEAMLVLSPASEIKTKRDLLIPTLECGPESEWHKEGFGFPWVLPLGIFARD